MKLNETHDSELKSFVQSANTWTTDFPIQNLPFAVFKKQGTAEAFRVGVGIGEEILDVSGIHTLLEGDARRAAAACAEPTINTLMSLGHAHWSALRLALSRMLRSGSRYELEVTRHLVKQRDVEYRMPTKVPNFTDCCASMDHIAKVFKVIRADNPALPESYKWIPLAFHSRASTLRASSREGYEFLRPKGQSERLKDGKAVYEPSQKLDYEAEIAIYLAHGTKEGQVLSVDEAEQAVFGLSVINDWTARDIMTWEMQPLGPFLSKSFTTTVSPWVVMMEALEPFRRAFVRADGFPDPLPNLDSKQNRERGAVDISVQVLLQTARGAADKLAPTEIGLSNVKDMYWTFGQLVAHHTSNGCSMEPGDMIGTGTISGPSLRASGCVVELTHGGANPITLPTGEKRGFVEDGDTVIVRAFCDAPGYRRIGFGDAAATVVKNPQ